jgi:hypothetical protein
MIQSAFFTVYAAPTAQRRKGSDTREEIHEHFSTVSQPRRLLLSKDRDTQTPRAIQNHSRAAPTPNTSTNSCFKKHSWIRQVSPRCSGSKCGFTLSTVRIQPHPDPDSSLGQPPASQRSSSITKQHTLLQCSSTIATLCRLTRQHYKR